LNQSLEIISSRKCENKSTSLPSPTTSGDETPLNVAIQDKASLRAQRVSTAAIIPIDQYIPVGCLVIDRMKIQGSVCTVGTPGWVEIYDQGVPSLLEVAVKSLSVDTDCLRRSVEALLRATWIRVTCAISLDSPQTEIWRVYVLPHDVSRASVGREASHLRAALDLLLPNLNVASVAWHGQCQDRVRHARHYRPEEQVNPRFDLWADGLGDSLFYLFNTLPSPDPSPHLIENHYLRNSVNKLLNPGKPVWGLKTELYPFQRRSAALMIQREVAPQMIPDPRLDQRESPTGQIYYYCARDRQFLRETRYYDTVRGGILAESMGHGKTLICLAVILTTKGQIPQVPPQHVDAQLLLREKVGTLMDMAAAATVRYQAPWGAELEKLKDIAHTECIHTIERNLPFYKILSDPIRSNRSTVIPRPAQKVYLFRGTLIVVPPNLVKQWQTELEKHVSEDFLRVLYMDKLNSQLPDRAELATYDVVLFSKNRFEKEARRSEASSVRSVTKNRSWKQAASDDDGELYVSPLQGIHWLRIIVDEGHVFSNSSSDAASFATALLAERRWVVSGTPARDLLGVDAEVIGDTMDEVETARQTALQQRREFNYEVENKSKAIKSIGALATSFLHAQPWYDERSAIWDEYIYRHEALGKGKRTYTSFSWCLAHTLESLVIKTQPEDVERDIVLPPITHRIVKLEPCVYDKLTANLFVLQFIANAVTSERVDVDFLFHRASRKHLVDLVRNLRLSAFTWSGFNVAHVESSLDIAEKYLAKEDARCSEDDRKLLIDTAGAARIVLQLASWREITEKALSGIHELGVMLEHWPEGSQDIWALDNCESPMIMDLAKLRDAQTFINERLELPNPADGLAGVGVRTRPAESRTAEDPVDTPFAITANRATALTSSGTMQMSPQRPRTAIQPTQNRKRRRHVKHTYIELPTNSSLARTQLVGTISTKLSYLISRISDLHKIHKCLIFYEGSHIAWFLGEALELLHIKNLIYTSEVDVSLRSQYIELFNSDVSQRVLLMDLRQAAHGLNITSATHIFFINPVCRPNIEAQAIKRAHRIGQTEDVYVETLVLRGTVEEAMQDRASKMTAGQHLAAKALEDDDGIRTILQEARIFQIGPEELVGHGCMAPLAVPQQIFGRPGRAPQEATALETEIFGDGDSDGQGYRAPRRRKQTQQKGEATGKERVLPMVKTEFETGDEEMPNTTVSAGTDLSMEGYTSLFS